MFTFIFIKSNIVTSWFSVHYRFLLLGAAVIRGQAAVYSAQGSSLLTRLLGGIAQHRTVIKENVHTEPEPYWYTIQKFSSNLCAPECTMLISWNILEHYCHSKLKQSQTKVFLSGQKKLEKMINNYPESIMKAAEEGGGEDRDNLKEKDVSPLRWIRKCSLCISIQATLQKD